VTIGGQSQTVQISYENHLLSNGENLQSIKSISTPNIRILNLEQTDTGLTYILVVSTDNAYTASKKVTFTYKKHHSENVFEPKLLEDEKTLRINLTDGTNFTVDLSSDIVWDGEKKFPNRNLNYELKKNLENGQNCEIQVWQAINPNNKISVDFKCPKGTHGTEDSGSSYLGLQSWPAWAKALLFGGIGLITIVIVIVIVVVAYKKLCSEDPHAEDPRDRQARIDAERKIAEDVRRVQEEMRQKELARGEQNIYVQAEPEPVVM